MRLSYQYKLQTKPSQEQSLDVWLDLLRALYNWLLNDRIEGYHQTFIEGEYCDIRTKTVRYPLTCSLTKNTLLHNPWKKPDKDGLVKKRSASLMQDAYLAEMKKARTWYKAVHSNVLQLLVKRLDDAMNGFFQGGKGYPKFKNRSNFRSFQYKPGDVKVEGNKVYLPSIGWVKFYNSRPIPDGFQIRTVTVRKKADGWYISILIEDNSIPDYPVNQDINTIIGLDMGLIKLVHCSDGSDFDNPKPATSKKAKRTLKIRQRRLSRKKKGSKNRKKEQLKVSKLHQTYTDKRTAYQWKVANQIVKKADAIALENLNIRGMKARCKPKPDEVNKGRFLKNGQSRKRGLNRAISDASWGTLMEKIEYTAAKSGKMVFKVDPKHTSQTCSKCGVIDALSRFGEQFLCTSCGHETNADKQAAINVKKRAIEKHGLKIKTVKKVRQDLSKPNPPLYPPQGGVGGGETPYSELTEVKRKKHPARNSRRDVPGNPPTQLSLWDIQDLA